MMGYKYARNVFWVTDEIKLRINQVVFYHTDP